MIKTRPTKPVKRKIERNMSNVMHIRQHQHPSSKYWSVQLYDIKKNLKNSNFKLIKKNVAFNRVLNQ